MHEQTEREYNYEHWAPPSGCFVLKTLIKNKHKQLRTVAAQEKGKHIKMPEACIFRIYDEIDEYVMGKGPNKFTVFICIYSAYNLINICV